MRTLCFLVLLCALVRADTISFETEGGGDREVATMLTLSENLYATVTVVGADPRTAVRGRVEGGGKLPLVAHDSVSRLTLLARPAGGDEISFPELGRGRGLKRGALLYLDPDDKDRPSRVVSWENSYEENVLPLTLMRVHHPSKESPRPGTPLYDADGKLVALCHQETDEYGNGTYALPAEVIAKVRQDLRAHGKAVRCWIGIVMEIKYAVPAIVTVRPESPAAVAGVKKGDILLSVGGHEVRSYADTLNAFYYLMEGEETEVTVLRGTQKLSLKVIPEISPLEKVEG